jgi:Leucine-rich repeat (LRR) protein
MLTGSLPSEIRLLTGLDLQKNSFSGTLPTELGDLFFANLTYLDISSNKFTGVFPESIANATQMIVVWKSPLFCFSSNLFTGNVLKDVGNS